ncbi:MAG TPA: hypothetical protein VGV93_07170 [Acidimicrobiales bacterium]|nr:hypothetical protein [Acidimicrobiales bacterium]
MRQPGIAQRRAPGTAPRPPREGATGFGQRRVATSRHAVQIDGGTLGAVRLRCAAAAAADDDDEVLHPVVG